MPQKQYTIAPSKHVNFTDCHLDANQFQKHSKQVANVIFSVLDTVNAAYLQEVDNLSKNFNTLKTITPVYEQQQQQLENLNKDIQSLITAQQVFSNLLSCSNQTLQKHSLIALQNKEVALHEALKKTYTGFLRISFASLTQLQQLTNTLLETNQRLSIGKIADDYQRPENTIQAHQTYAALTQHKFDYSKANLDIIKGSFWEGALYNYSIDEVVTHIATAKLDILLFKTSFDKFNQLSALTKPKTC